MQNVRLRLKVECAGGVASLVEKAVDLDLDAFARRAALASARCEKRTRFFERFSFDAPLFKARYKHPRVK